MAVANRYLLAAVLLAILGVSLAFWGGDDVRPASRSAAVVDPDALAQLPEFVEAEKKLSERGKAHAARLQELQKTREPDSPAVRSQQEKSHQQLDKLRGEVMGPLDERLTQAIGRAASGRGFDVVLDARIVLEGLPDLTEAVKTQFARQDAEAAPEANAQRCSIAFVDQARVGRLNDFRTVESRLLKYHEELGRSFQQRSRRLSAEQRAELDGELVARFEERKTQLYDPLRKRVRAIVDALSSEHGLSLVVDRQHVLWGGRDLTREVVARLQDPELAGAPPGRRPERIGMVSAARLLGEMPEYRDQSRRYEEEHRKLFGASGSRDPWKALSARKKQIDASLARWEKIRDAFIATATTRMRSAAEEVARDKDLAVVLVDAPWNPGYPLEQQGAEDVTTDVLFEMAGR